MNPYFTKFLNDIKMKAPRAMADMAHYHNGKDELKIKPEMQETWNNAFSFVECLIPPPVHPTRPDDGLAMEFKVSNKVLGIQSFWLSDTGNLTQDPEAARVVPKGWQSISDLRNELRTKAHEGIRLLRVFLKEQAGVPSSAIYDNLP